MNVKIVIGVLLRMGSLSLDNREFVLGDPEVERSSYTHIAYPQPIGLTLIQCDKRPKGTLSIDQDAIWSTKSTWSRIQFSLQVL